MQFKYELGMERDPYGQPLSPTMQQKKEQLLEVMDQPPATPAARDRREPKGGDPKSGTAAGKDAVPDHLQLKLKNAPKMAGLSSFEY